MESNSFVFINVVFRLAQTQTYLFNDQIAFSGHFSCRLVLFRFPKLPSPMFQNLQNCYAIQRKKICIICQDIVTCHITVASHSELIAEKHVRRLLAFFYTVHVETNHKTYPGLTVSFTIYLSVYFLL